MVRLLLVRLKAARAVISAADAANRDAISSAQAKAFIAMLKEYPQLNEAQRDDLVKLVQAAGFTPSDFAETVDAISEAAMEKRRL